MEEKNVQQLRLHRQSYAAYNEKEMKETTCKRKRDNLI